MLVKKVTYFEEFGYLNSSCIRKSILLMFMSFSRDKLTFLTDVSVSWFPAAMLELILMGSNMASPYKSLLIWVKHFSAYLA